MWGIHISVWAVAQCQGEPCTTLQKQDTERPEVQWSSGVPGPQDLLCHNHLSLPSSIHQSQTKDLVFGVSKESWEKAEGPFILKVWQVLLTTSPDSVQVPLVPPPRMQMSLCNTSHQGLYAFFCLEVHLWVTFLRGDISDLWLFSTMILLDTFMHWRGSEVLRGLRVFNFIQVSFGNQQCMGICLRSCLFVTRADRNNLS